MELLHERLANRPEEPDEQAFDDWHADVVGVVRAYDRAHAVPLELLLGQITNPMGGRASAFFGTLRADAAHEFLARARALFVQLRLETGEFLAAQVRAGAMHDYFEHVREILGRATRDVLFVDRYLDPDFLNRYGPQVPAVVRLRLLTRHGSGMAVAEAARLFTGQHGLTIEVRTFPERIVHDRHLVIDGQDVFQSGASFKDGGHHAPTTIVQLVDGAATKVRELEEIWQQGRPVP